MPLLASPWHLRPRGSGLRLPDALQRRIQPLVDTSLDDIRIHVGTAPASLGALAMTHDSNILIAPAAWQPLTARGQALLVREVAHVAQQRAGRVVNPLGHRMALVWDEALEREAEALSAQLTAGQRSPGGPRASAPVVQGFFLLEALESLFRPQVVLPPRFVEAPRRLEILAPDDGFVGVEELFRATLNRGWSGDRTYRWRVTSGSARLAAEAGQQGNAMLSSRSASAYFVAQEPGTVRVSVSCDDGGHSVGPAQHTITVFKRHKIPALLHFIWAGGTRPMPNPSLANVKQWVRLNPHLRVMLWVDKQSDPQVVSRYRDRGPGIALMDINKEGIVSPWVRYEIDKLWPNYGSSSDLLRYAILHKYGGAYFDSDVFPGVIKLEESSPFAVGARSTFLVNANSQNQGKIGNDAFICGPGDPVIRAIHLKAMANYETIDSMHYDHNFADFFDDYTYRREATIERTGPGTVRRVLELRGISDDGVALPREHQFPPGIVTVPQEASNTEGWLKVPVKRMKFEQAVATAAASMKFEIELMGMFRTVDHVCQIAVSQQENNNPPLTTCERLQGYASAFYTINRNSQPDEDEELIVSALKKALAELKPDLGTVRRLHRAGKQLVVEKKNRYPAFAEYYKTIVG